MWASWLWIAATAAWADDPCSTVADGFPVGPVQAALRDGGLGAPRRACGRTEVAASVGGRMTVDLANFYGYIPGSLNVDASGQVGRGFELFGRLEAARADIAIASFSSTVIGLGHLQLGGAWSGQVGDRVVVGAHASTVLPTAYPLYKHAAPFGFDLGFEVSAQVHPQVEVHGSLVGLTSFAAGKGPDLARGGADISAGFAWRPVRQFGLAVDLDSGFGLRNTVDHVSPALALRFGDGRRFGFELGLRAPLVGAHRELVAFGLRASARLGAMPAR